MKAKITGLTSFINANRNQNLYSQSGLAVFSDCLDGFQGPLSGMLTGLKSAKRILCFLFLVIALISLIIY